METCNLFVYGTLKTTSFPGVYLNRLKHKEATATGTMYNINNRYPGVVFGEGDSIIFGQVFLDIPDNIFEVLDQYEGVSPENPLYRRITVSIKCGDEEIKAFAYEAADKALAFSVEEVESGDWDEYMNNYTLGG